MSIYNYNTNTVADQLTPPILRQSKFLSWLYVLVKPISNLWSQVFEDYKTGSVYNNYSSLTTYNFGDKVKWTNNSIYEATYTDSNGLAQSFSSIDPSNTTYWTLINENFIGTDERIKINSQIILLEYYLNRWYNIDSLSDQIYIQNLTYVNNVFVMGNSSTYSSTMPNDSNYSETFMGLNPTYPNTSYDFVVWIPNAVWTTLGTNFDNRYNNVAKIVDKYKLSGIKYLIDTY